jgi:hypothetical protein
MREVVSSALLQSKGKGYTWRTCGLAGVVQPCHIVCTVMNYSLVFRVGLGFRI